MITKRIQILEILYPKGIKKEQYGKIDKIFESIDNLIEETKDITKPIPQVIKDVPIKSITMSEAMEEIEKHPLPTKYIDYYPVFIETNPKDAPTFSKSLRADFDDIYQLKQNLHYKVVNRDRTTITAHLDYLTDYYNKLPKTFNVDDIQGLSKTKTRLLYKFYLASPKFKNHEDKIGTKKYIVKDI